MARPTLLPADPASADPHATPELLAVSRGEASADLALERARIVCVFTREILSGTVLIHGRRIAAVLLDDAGPARVSPPARERIDLAGSFLAPGFIDAHMHVESTMLPPSGFVRLAAPHGTTGVVLDPHEIANVHGVPGLRAIMDDARGLPMRIMFALSSCVPSCHLETSGATILARDLAPLFDDERVVALAEMMNFPGVVHADPDVLAKVNLGLEQRQVDGHAPGLDGRPLQAYLAAGIGSDHECTTLDEAKQKLRLGMQIFIREGSAARNLQALLPLITPANAWRFCFATDDRHPADLRGEGHIDHVVRRAIALGLDPATALSIASLHTARHYRQPFRGAVAPGHFADLIVFDDLSAPRPRVVFFEGTLTARDGQFLGPPALAPPVLRARFPIGAVRLPAGLAESSFRVPAPGSGYLRVIGMDPHQLLTEHRVRPALVHDGAAVSDPDSDLLKLAVIERHAGSGAIGLGFVEGFGLRRGAIASTVGHDAHNLAVLGVNDADMLAAARALSESRGGQCAVLDGRVLALLPLPIAGLMSDQAPETVIAQQRALLEAVTVLGCPLHDPFMPLSFMPLPVIPALKLSDRGLVDVDRFEIVSLEAPAPGQSPLAGPDHRSPHA